MLHLVATDENRLAETLADPFAGARVLGRDPGCFMASHSPHSAAIEADDPEALVAVAEAVRSFVDADRSMAIVGVNRVFIDPPATPSPVRYQYLMHRRDDFTHEAYLERYESIHYEFGMRTPNLDGYVQLHVDLDASADLAAATGLQAEPCDSMSELHIQSVAHFLEGIVAHPEVGQEAAEDEERFVDRPRSFGFAHRVIS